MDIGHIPDIAGHVPYTSHATFLTIIVHVRDIAGPVYNITSHVPHITGHILTSLAKKQTSVGLKP